MLPFPPISLVEMLPFPPDNICYHWAEGTSYKDILYKDILNKQKFLKKSEKYPF
jgi:hypothetical protein